MNTPRTAPSSPSGEGTPAARPVQDPPGRGSRGFEIVLIVVYGIFALSATARSLVQVLRDLSYAPVAYGLSLVAALTYIAVTVALVRGGRRSVVARVLCLVELVGVLVVGTLTIADPELFPDATVWSVFGRGYGYVPLALPVIALVYLVWSTRRGPAGAASAR